MNKKEIAEIFEEMALFLEINDENPLRIQAYKSAAQSLLSSEKDLTLMIREGALTELDGIGTDFAEEISTLAKTGHLPHYDQLKRSIPENFYELFKIRGLGPKKIRILYETLKIDSVEKLREACEAGDLTNIPGFDEQSNLDLLKMLTHYENTHKKCLWWEAMEIALPILESIKQIKEVSKAEITGKYRRRMETVSSLDFLVASPNPQPILLWFINQPAVKKVISSDSTTAKIRLPNGIQSELKIVPEEHFAFTLLSSTGSTKHITKLSERASQKGWSLIEMGLKKKATETDIYKALDLTYIPPEIREARGEIEAAAKGDIPTLVEVKDLRGTFHNHTTASDGINSLLDMAIAAERLGWEYLGISDHSKSNYQANGLNENGLLNQIEQIQELNDSKRLKLKVFSGSECDILPNGTLDFPDSLLKKLDYVIVSIHNSLSQDKKALTNRLIKAIEHPLSTMIGHITGRSLLTHAGYEVDLQKVIDACIANRKMIELNGNPQRLDMDWRLWHAASEKGLLCCLNTDAHSIDGHRFVLAGVNIARKGWLQKQHIFNTRPLKEIIRYFHPS